MTIVHMIIVLVVVGVLLYLVNNYIPWMDSKVKQILNIAVVVGIVIWLLYAFGILGSGIGDIRVPQVK